MEKLESDLRDYAIDLVNRNVCPTHQLGDYLTGYLAQDTLSGIGHLARIAASNQQRDQLAQGGWGDVTAMPTGVSVAAIKSDAQGAQESDELSHVVNRIVLSPSGDSKERAATGIADDISTAPFPDERERVPQTADGGRVGQMVADNSGMVPPALASTNNQEVLMDPGHGDHNDENSMIDSGAVAKHNGVVYKEKDLALQFSNTVGTELARLGHTVSYTRGGDVDNADLEKLKWRIDIADKKKPNAFISIHLDSAGKNATGLSVYANKEGAQLKRQIEDAVTATDVRDVQPKSLFVLRNNKRPAVLIEVGFITNPDDVKTIQNPDLAKEVAAGIDAYFKSTHMAESNKK